MYKNINMISIIIILAMGFFSFGFSTTEVYNSYQMQPEVYHFAKPEFGNVDAKGDLNLEIPVMTVPGRNGLDFPINLRYHSGITVFQSASWIGLGWEWEPGSVSRDVMGSMIYNGSVMGVDFPGSTDEYANDIYYVSIDGSSTPIYKRSYGSITGLEPTNTFYPNIWKQWKINFCNVNDIAVDGKITTEDDYGSIIVTKEDGTRYIFEEPTLAYYNNINTSWVISPTTREKYVSVWRLVAILGADYPEECNLIPSGSEPGSWIRIDYQYEPTDVIGTFVDPSEFHANAALHQLTYVKEVTTPTHKAVFATQTRGDWALKINEHTQSVHKRLSQIELFSRQDLVNSIGKVELKHSLIGGTSLSERTALDSIRIFGSSNTTPQVYKFNYWNKTESAENAKLLLQYDDFGFLNKAATAFGNFNADTVSAKSWSLKHIIYPTGAMEKYHYQNDYITSGVAYYDFVQNDTSMTGPTSYTLDTDKNYQGGIRIRMIEQKDGMGNLYVYQYQYSTGSITSVPSYFFQRPSNSVISNNCAYRGNSAVYYSWIKKINPDLSYIVTSYTVNYHPNLFCYCRTREITGEYRHASIMRENRDWNWGLPEATDYFDNTGKKLKKFYTNYSFNEIILDENSWDVRYSLKYFMGIQRVNHDQIKEYNPNEVTKYITKTKYYSYNSNFQINGFTESGFNGDFDEKKKTTLTYAYEKYPDLVDLNIFTSIAMEKTYGYNENDIEEVYFEQDLTGLPGQSPVRDTISFYIKYDQTVNYDVTLVQSIDKINGSAIASYIIKEKNGATRVYVSSGNNFYAESGSFSAKGGIEYLSIAYVNAYESDFDRSSVHAEVTYEDDQGVYYSAKVNTWKEFTIPDLINAQWKPYRTYVLNSSEPLDYISFSAWSPTSTPTESFWLNSETAMNYDAYGHVIQKKDGMGNLLNLYYGDNTNNLSNSASGLYHAYLTGISMGGLSRKFDYDVKRGLVSSIEDENNNFTYYYYDHFGRLNSIKNNSLELINSYEYFTNPDSTLGGGLYPNYVRMKTCPTTTDSIITKEFYDGFGRKIQTQVKNGTSYIVSALNYDTNGREWKNWNSYSYNTGGNFDAAYSSRIAYYTTKSYDALDRLTMLIPQGESSSNSIRTSYSIDPTSPYTYTYTTTTDEDEKVIEDRYDVFGKKISSIQNPGGLTATTNFKYDIMGNCVEIVNPRGQVIALKYDTRNLLMETNHPDAGKTKYRYDANGNLIFQQDAVRRQDASYGWVYYLYDALNRKTEEGLANIAPTAEPTNYTTFSKVPKQTFEYDLAGHTNAKGRLARAYDVANNDSVSYNYDWKGRIASLKNSIGYSGISTQSTQHYTVQYNYNNADQVTRITYPNAIYFDQYYNSRGLLRAINGLYGSSTSDGFSYNATGLPVTISATGGKTISLGYDNRNRLTSENGSNMVWDNAYTYNKNSNLAFQINNSDSYFYSTSYQYDALNRLTTVTDLGTQSQVRSYNYDLNGNRTSKNGSTYYYNTGKNQLKGIGTTSVQFTYDANGNLKEDTRNGYKTTFLYDYKNRLIGIRPEKWNLWYATNSSNSEPGDCKIETNGSDKELHLYGSNNTGMKYASRTISTFNLSNPYLEFSFYFRQPAGVDADQFVFYWKNASTGTYLRVYYFERQRDLTVGEYSPANGYTSIFSNYNIDLRSGATCKFTISGGVVSFYLNGVLQGSATKDAAIQYINLVEIQVGEAHYHVDDIVAYSNMYGHPYSYTLNFEDGPYGPYADYRYNTNDERIMKISPDILVSEGKIRLYIYDGNGNVLSEYNRNGALKFNYIYGNGKKLARKNASGTVNFMYTDYLGSVRVISDVSTWVRNYYPFGEEYTALSTGNEYKFTGKEWDEESDLYYSWHRYYRSEWGRFTQVDRKWMKYPSQSPYQYCFNNPLRYIDNTGDTVTVDSRLLDDSDLKDENDDYINSSDMTTEQRQRNEFQLWWSENSEMVNKLYGIGGKYEKTNVKFELGFSGESLFKIKYITRPWWPGRVEWGKQGTNPKYFYDGGQPVKPDFGINDLQLIVYLNPIRFPTNGMGTINHEWKHLSFIFDCINKGYVVPTGEDQHKIIGYSY